MFRNEESFLDDDSDCDSDFEIDGNLASWLSRAEKIVGESKGKVLIQTHGFNYYVHSLLTDTVLKFSKSETDAYTEFFSNSKEAKDFLEQNNILIEPVDFGIYKTRTFHIDLVEQKWSEDGSLLSIKEKFENKMGKYEFKTIIKTYTTAEVRPEFKGTDEEPFSPWFDDSTDYEALCGDPKETALDPSSLPSNTEICRISNFFAIVQNYAPTKPGEYYYCRLNIYNPQNYPTLFYPDRKEISYQDNFAYMNLSHLQAMPDGENLVGLNFHSGAPKLNFICTKTFTVKIIPLEKNVRDFLVLETGEFLFLTEDKEDVNKLSIIPYADLVKRNAPVELSEHKEAFFGLAEFKNPEMDDKDKFKFNPRATPFIPSSGRKPG